MEKLKCPCCGYLTIQEDFDVCPVCYWEHDPVQESDEKSYMGANNNTCLLYARLTYLFFGYCHEDFALFVRKPKEGE